MNNMTKFSTDIDIVKECVCLFEKVSQLCFFFFSLFFSQTEAVALSFVLSFVHYYSIIGYLTVANLRSIEFEKP